MDVLCTFKIQIEKQNSEHGYSKDQCQYPNQDQDAKTQSRMSIVLQSPKSGLKGHGCPLHLQNQGRELKFRTGDYQIPQLFINQYQDAKRQSGTSRVL